MIPGTIKVNASREDKRKQSGHSIFRKSSERLDNCLHTVSALSLANLSYQSVWILHLYFTPGLIRQWNGLNSVSML